MMVTPLAAAWDEGGKDVQNAVVLFKVFTDQSLFHGEFLSFCVFRLKAGNRFLPVSAQSSGQSSRRSCLLTFSATVFVDSDTYPTLFLKLLGLWSTYIIKIIRRKKKRKYSHSHGQNGHFSRKRKKSYCIFDPLMPITI